MRGLLYVAHNNGLFDYGTMSYCSALSARHHLNNPPIALITDKETWDDLLKVYPLAEGLFMEPIFVTAPDPESNIRTYQMGFDGSSKKAAYKNGTRSEVYDLSPFDETLMVDSDVLFLDNSMNKVWGSNNSVMVNKKIGHMRNPHSMKPFMQRLHDMSIPTYWATITYFRRSPETRDFFSVVNQVRKDFHYYGLLYKFETSLYRNDFAFSVASHLMGNCLGAGYEFIRPLPVPHLTFAWDHDTLIEVDKNRAMFLVSTDGRQVPSTVYETVHVMNKQSMMDMADRIIEVYGGA